MRVFWDTNLFIYLIERHPQHYAKVVELYSAQRARGDVLLTSTLTLGELLAQPIRRGRFDLVEQYKSLLMTARGLELVTFTYNAAMHYASIRAEARFKQPDAIQLACAIAGGAEVFITNDRDLWGNTRGLMVRGFGDRE